MNEAQLSASCFCNQVWRFLFLAERATLEQTRKALSVGNSWAKTAPLLIVGFSKPDLDCQMKLGVNIIYSILAWRASYFCYKQLS